MTTIYADFVIRLIEAVRERQHLYDKKHVSYFNRSEREKSWRELAEQLGQNVDECQKRWKLLREKLFKELIKRDRILATGQEFHSDWACFERMSFIEHHITVRKKNERFAPYNLDDTIPGTNDATQSGDDAPASTTPPINKLSQRQHSINYKRLFSNVSSQEFALTTDDDTNNTSVKVEPNNVLELEQHFEDSRQKDEEPQCMQSKPVIQEPVQMTNSLKVKSFAKVQEATDDTDVIFGRLVTAMLRDIPSETFRDDAKLQVMQLLIHAKRNAVNVMGNMDTS